MPTLNERIDAAEEAIERVESSRHNDGDANAFAVADAMRAMLAIVVDHAHRDAPAPAGERRYVLSEDEILALAYVAPDALAQFKTLADVVAWASPRLMFRPDDTATIRRLLADRIEVR